MPARTGKPLVEEMVNKEEAWVGSSDLAITYGLELQDLPFGLMVHCLLSTPKTPLFLGHLSLVQLPGFYPKGILPFL